MNPRVDWLLIAFWAALWPWFVAHSDGLTLARRRIQDVAPLLSMEVDV